MHAPRSLAVAVTGVMLLASGVGCGRKSIAETPEPVNESAPPLPAPVSATSRPAPTNAYRMSEPPDAAAEARRVTLEARIYFGFDRADLTAEAQTTLVNKVDILRAEPTVTVRIEGHADERGSDEYNLALSNRRAATAKQFLVQRGIDAKRLEAVGYGEEQPLATGHDEQAWAINRRADFRITHGLGAR